MQTVETIRKILKIARLHIVLGGFLAFTLGTLLGVAGGGKVEPLKVALFYLIVFFGDLSTHYSNDYFDVKEDKSIGKNKFFSGKKILVNNPNIVPFARITSLIFLSISVILAIIVVMFGSAPIELLIITLGANFLGWFYSAPPLRLVSRGLGEAAIAIAAGLAIPAIGYLSVRGQFDFLFVLFVIPFVLYGFMLSLSLEAPDVEGDSRNSKKNIGVRKGKKTVFSLILASSLAAFLFLISYALQINGLIVNFWALTIFSIAPLAGGIMGFIGYSWGKNADIFSAINILSLFLFNILMIVYLFIIIPKF